MGGSQLKRLKATLKQHGLTGQTNVKKNNKSKKGPVDSRRDDREKITQKIREEFNPFEIKVNRKKFDVEGKSSKGAVGRPGISKQIGEEERKAAYEHRKSRKNKMGALVDRRFGENNPELSLEEKMLERFTREKQSGASKRSLFNLDDDEDQDDDDNGGFQLTHYGKSLGDTFDQGDLGLADDSTATKRYHDEDDEQQQQQPPKKKTKAEVMKEVMAKAKYYKHGRQKQQATRENQIGELNENFDDVMSELRTVAFQPKPKQAASEKTEKDIEYGQQMRKLTMERRAAPADRTKTEEELEKERLEHKKKLEEDRLRRMEGLERDHAEGDDLDEAFWEQNSDDEANGFAVDGEEGEEEENEDEESSNEADQQPGGRFKNKSILKLVKCPETHEEFLEILKDTPQAEVMDVVKKILSTYKLGLAAGNKEKLANFTKVIIDHVLHLADTDFSQTNYEAYTETQTQLIKILKKLASKFMVAMTECFREHVDEISNRLAESIKSNDFSTFPKVSDMIFFTLIGVLYSTSDHYHLVVTPAQILLCQSINQIRIDSIKQVGYGLFVCDLLLQYQRFSKRYVPEVSAFLQSVLLAYHPKPQSAGFASKLTVPYPSLKLHLKSYSVSEEDLQQAQKIKINELVNSSNLDNKLFFIKTVELIDRDIQTWKDKSAFVEISSPFVSILESFNTNYCKSKFVKLDSLVSKLNNLRRFAVKEHQPLQLQSHKPIAIPTYAPKFEENYNPEKKSYDPDRQRQEINKVKAQIKKERKLTVRELRKDNKFMAREHINETKAKYADYHKKMASIINSINTVEGNERNQYDKEKRQRKSSKK